jgi:hypothetical protein
VGRPWGAEFAGAVGSSTVVVLNVICEDHTQVPLIEDQHAVGEFGSESAHEPFGETVRRGHGHEQCVVLLRPRVGQSWMSADVYGGVPVGRGDILALMAVYGR